MAQNILPKVFVVILNYNGGDAVKACLDSVFRITYPNLETIFVDNNSTDGSFELAKRLFSRLYFIKNKKNVGFAAGNNVGIQLALKKEADYVFLLNNDAVVEINILDKLVSFAECHKKAGIINPLIRSRSSEEIWFSGAKIKWLSMKAVHNFNIESEKPYKTDYATGCAMLIKREVFEKAGLLDEDFFLYYEDADFCTRAGRKGFWSFVVPEAKVRHSERGYLDLDNKIYWLVISGILFFQKNTPVWLKPWMHFFLFLRKLKNRRDLRDGQNKTAKMVRKAYEDIKKYGK